MSLYRWALTVVLLGAAELSGTASHAAVIGIDETMSGKIAFGDLRQTDTTACSGIDGTQACGPTAAVNSFVFLQNKYPTIYDNSLIPPAPPIIPFNPAYSNLISAANTLGTAKYMGCTCTGGTNIKNFIFGKEKYITDQVGEGKTDYAFETVFKLSTRDTTKPNYDFLSTQLKQNEDVELFVSYHDATGYTNSTGQFYGGHFLTMTGLTLNDTNDNGTFDMPEMLSLNFIDPLTGAPGMADGLLNMFGFDTTYGAGGAITGASIAGIVSESPVPEPATFVLLASGLGALAGLRRRNRKPNSFGS